MAYRSKKPAELLSAQRSVGSVGLHQYIGHQTLQPLAHPLLQGSLLLLHLQLGLILECLG
ncbi:Uncharacterised protein [Vibrio cholerae]|nr:Uncharacterised protein [Vibrio cholerae]CSC48292.1 Uncharacterised protein [Vibrio cholerae]CSI82950.1 Uncharacterised protein [Vibrio cholerae]